jgi:hypothetical protein
MKVEMDAATRRSLEDYFIRVETALDRLEARLHRIEGVGDKFTQRRQETLKVVPSSTAEKGA